MTTDSTSGRSAETLFLALKEMRRARTRFALLSAAVGLLVFLILFQQSLLDGLVTQFIGAIRAQDAQVLVLSRDAKGDLEGSRVSLDDLATVGAVDGVSDFGRLNVGGYTISTDTSRADADPKLRLLDASVWGYDLGGLGGPKTLVDGVRPTQPNEILAPTDFEDKGLRLGSTVRIEPGDIELTIVGRTKDLVYGVRPALFMSWETVARAAAARNPDAAEIAPTAFVLQPGPGVSPKTLVERVNAAVPNVQALTRGDAADNAPVVASVSTTFSTIINLLRFVVLLTCGLFFLILTAQKTSTLTVLRAMGAKSSTLVEALLIQVVMVVVAGSVLACMLQALVSIPLKSVGVTLDFASALATTGVVLVLALVGTALGAIRRIVKIDPVAATGLQGASS